MLVQDQRPDVVVAIPQLESRLDVAEKKSKKSSLEKAFFKFKIKSDTRRYVKKEQKCKDNIYLLFFTT